MDISAELADSLDAAATDADWIHHDLCHTAADQSWCECGVPKLLRDLQAAFVAWNVGRLFEPGKLE